MPCDVWPADRQHTTIEDLTDCYLQPYACLLFRFYVLIFEERDQDDAELDDNIDDRNDQRHDEREEVFVRGEGLPAEKDVYGQANTDEDQRYSEDEEFSHDFYINIKTDVLPFYLIRFRCFRDLHVRNGK